MRLQLRLLSVHADVCGGAIFVHEKILLYSSTYQCSSRHISLAVVVMDDVGRLWKSFCVRLHFVRVYDTQGVPPKSCPAVTSSVAAAAGRAKEACALRAYGCRGCCRLARYAESARRDPRGFGVQSIKSSLFLTKCTHQSIHQKQKRTRALFSHLCSGACCTTRRWCQQMRRKRRRWPWSC